MASNLIDPNTTPIMMPPEGVIPNFETPVSIAYISRDVTYPFLSLMLAFLSLRLYTRAVITHNFGVDDGKYKFVIRGIMMLSSLIVL